MNIKVAVGILVSAVVLIGAYVALNRGADNLRPEREGSATTTTDGVKDSSTPTFKFGSTTQSTAYAYVDSSSLVSSESYPTITGTANISEVDIVVYTEEGVGLVGTGDIPVIGGKWSYSIPVALQRGYYRVVVGGGAEVITAILKIN